MIGTGREWAIWYYLKTFQRKNHRFISFTNGTTAYIIKKHRDSVKKRMMWRFSTHPSKIEKKGIIVTVKKWPIVSFGYFVRIPMFLFASVPDLNM